MCPAANTKKKVPQHATAVPHNQHLKNPVLAFNCKRCHAPVYRLGRRVNPRDKHCGRCAFKLQNIEAAASAAPVLAATTAQHAPRFDGGKVVLVTQQELRNMIAEALDQRGRAKHAA